MIKVRIGAIVAAALLGNAFGVAAQTSYPTKPIKMIVGFAAAGPTDILSRVVGTGMSKVLGEQIVVENRTGASGNIATEAAARAEPDGYTLHFAPFSNAVNESLYKDFKIRFATHFEPIGAMAQTGLVLLVHPAFEAKSVADLIRVAKAKPGDLLYASAGAGTATHLAAELFNYMAGTKMMPVHYKGGGDTIKDLLSGEVKIMFSTIPPVISFVRDGKLRGLATAGAQRALSLPDLPTIAEAGVPDFDMTLWFGMVAPKATPRPIVDKLASAMKAALASPDVQQAMAKQGFTSMELGPQEFGRFYAQEAAKWAKVVDALALGR